ncbi:efflux RND transporter permease subunit [uncultured Mesonia sp.]|uniref:efflux RND transporter permease subunit n=1 Tax=uncultured Mesonia sp. TaxID=399731 RepID=UPI00374E8982
MKEGIAGKIAKSFIQSKLTILLMIVFMVVGVWSSFLIPREEEPQIEVPMADIFIGYPGASPQEVESRVIEPLEKILTNITGVKHVQAVAQKDGGMLIAQFYVGEDTERSYVKLYNEIQKHMDLMPSGVSMPLVKTRAIDDVPVLGLTLWSEHLDDYMLKQIAQETRNAIEKIPDVSQTSIIGGRSKEMRISIDKNKLRERQLDLQQVVELIGANNHKQYVGKFNQNDTEYQVKTGRFLKSQQEVEQLIVGTQAGKPVYLKQIAQIEETPERSTTYVSLGFGKGHDAQQDFQSEYPAVTLSIAKRKGADAMQLADKILEKVESLRASTLTPDVHVEVTRNYGETASQKVSELLLHLIGAIIAVTLVVMMAMGWRGGLVVFLSVPITFALTLLSYYMLDYTLNRITLFALVFVTGIVVDDSIIIAENMHRHFKMKKLAFKDAALYAINEVGNPTILATFTVIASVLPMAFVSGMMGPYMSPMPIGASIAMILSLFVALTITPYLGFIFLREKEKKEAKPKAQKEGRGIIYNLYNKFERPLLERKAWRWGFLLGTFGILFLSMGLFFTESVAVKMLPFDNKNEFQLIIDMPEGTSLERTAVVTREIGQFLKTRPEVVSYQNYVGTAAPITFNGLVRHYDLRAGSHTADIQVNLRDKKDRSEQSHAIAKLLRPHIQAIGDKFGANIKVVEVPPGPPVLSTIVAEIYGPDYDQQLQLAKDIKQLLRNTSDVVDVDWMSEDLYEEYNLIVNQDKAMLQGISTQKIVQTAQLALAERSIGRVYQPEAAEAVNLVLSLTNAQKNHIDAITDLSIKNANGQMIPLHSLVSIEKRQAPQSIYRKDQKRVVFVTADMAGVLESPVYAILGMTQKLKELDLPVGYQIDELYLGSPENETDYTVKWDGEWQVTLEVFRDLGIAFLGVIIIIYMLIVGWFQNFKAPIVMMVAIPLSLIGIILGHWMMGAFFTATSFIGMIALAGIMVRNSVLLIDFINLQLAEGMPFKEAVIEAGAVRTTPILLTAGTVVIGAFVILFDPIFQGLAISLMGGTIASTFLTLLVVPLVYYLVERKNHP